jgi:hypothetical protein
VGKSYEFSLHLKDSDRYYENPSEVIKTIRRVVKAGILDSDDPKKKEAKKLAIALGFT